MISKWKKTGKLSIVGKIWVLFVIGLIVSIPQLFSTNFNLLDIMSNNYSEEIKILFLVLGIISGILSIVVNILFQPAFYLGQQYVYLKVVREEKFSIKDAFYGFNNYKKAIKLYLIMMLYIVGGLILFIIPGIILAYRYSMCFYILADEKDISVRECLKKSKEITSGYKMDLFLMDLSFIGWLVLSLLTLGILSIWLTPYMLASRTTAYLDLNPIEFVNESE